MKRPLTPDEILLLRERFALAPAIERFSESVLPAASLCDPQACAEAMAATAERAGYPNQKVTASTFVKRYAKHTAAAAFYAMSVMNLKLDWSADKCLADTAFVTAPRTACAGLTDWTGEAMPDLFDEAARHEAIDALVHDLFAEHLTPMVTALKAATKVNAQILWENVAEAVYPIYDRVPEDVSLEGLVRLKTDYAYLLNGIAPEVFGLDFNPLKKFDLHDEAGRRTRKTCCLRYQVSRYCRNCPLRHKAH